MGLLFFFRSNSMYYFSIAFAVLYVLDNWKGRVNALSVYLLLVVSPVVGNVVYLWSFPIRLKLSEWAAAALRWLYTDISVTGNLLSIQGNTFSVDPACIGLKMLITSMVLAIVMLAYVEKKYQVVMSFGKIALLLSGVLLLAVFANFIRLLTLIVFHILPENPLHEAIGILSLVFYALLPFYFFVKYFFGKNHHSAGQGQLPKQRPHPAAMYQLLYVLILSGILYHGIRICRKADLSPPPPTYACISGFEEAPGSFREMQAFQNEEALLYLKAPVRFFQGSHDPRYCWQGSGYVFSKVQIENIGGLDCYTALLKKDDHLLYTAWWYQSQKNTTPYEWDWRWDNLKNGGAYHLVNLTCNSRQNLLKWVKMVRMGLEE
ncbi:MAG TPA: exosortase N [Bacteroidetes bacterium]|nr:exosortase N [Bacteroidota bacterium]